VESGWPHAWTVRTLVRITCTYGGRHQREGDRFFRIAFGLTTSLRHTEDFCIHMIVHKVFSDPMHSQSHSNFSNFRGEFTYGIRFTDSNYFDLSNKQIPTEQVY
jgi:hypothetical protein